MSLKNTCACMEKPTGGKTPGTKRGTIPCSTTKVNILWCPGTRRGVIPCSTTQVNILWHHISKTLWICHYHYIRQHLWLIRDKLGIQISSSKCSRYLGYLPGIYNIVHGNAVVLPFCSHIPALLKIFHSC